MSVFFKDISPDNPVRKGDVEALLEKHLGVNLDPAESDDYHALLAAVYDCAEYVSGLPDYQPVPDVQRYPRRAIRRPRDDEQQFGAAWAHLFQIWGSRTGSSKHGNKDESRNTSSTYLEGKTVCIKDCIAVAGVPQFYGSDAFLPWTPATDATVVTRVLDAGADIMGTANCEHFCNSTASFTSAQGTVENPHKLGYSAGGSTSGGAALVAGGIVDVAIGTDQGGSIRVPSALCGCVGFKPSHGLIPFTGITSGDAIDDHAGPIARTVLDVARCLDATAGYDGIDDRSLGAGVHGSYNFAAALSSNSHEVPKLRLSNLKIGVLTEGFEQDVVDPRVKAVVRSAIDKFRQLGASVQEVSVPGHLDGPAVWTIQQRISGALGIVGKAHGRRGLYLTEFEQARLPWTTPAFARLFASTKNTVINGLYLADKFPGLYGRAVNIGRRIRDAYEQALKDVDVLVMPTTPFVAPRHGTRTSLPRASFDPTVGMTVNTAVFNVTGHPALSIPVGWAPAADDASVLLPVGMQIVAGLGQDAKALAVGHAWESNFDWKEEGTEGTRKKDIVVNGSG